MRLLGPILLAVGLLALTTAAIGDLGTLDPCDADRLGASYGPLPTIYRVTDGELDGVCHGVDDEAVYRAWSALTVFTTPAERSTIKGFGGFVNNTDEDVIAYAATLNLEQTEFLIAVDLRMVDMDMWAVQRVMVHEFGHVITGTAQGVDRKTNSDCKTENRFGCVSKTNYLSLWVDQFWTEAELEALERNGSRSSSEASRRCSSDPGFVSLYGATNPGEDFAESFTFFMFSNRLAEPTSPRLRFFASFPQLVAMRDRLTAAGHADTRTYIHDCS